MNRFIAFATACCLGLTAVAQNPMTLKGVSLDLNLDEFVHQMENKGVVNYCENYTEQSSSALLRGTCFGFQKSYVFVLADKPKGNIRGVSVEISPLYEQHAVALFEFRELTKHLETIYGQPVMKEQVNNKGIWTNYRVKNGFVTVTLYEASDNLYQIKVKLEKDIR